MEPTEPTALQRKWETTLASAHTQLRAMIPMMGAMTVAEVGQFVDALETVRRGELWASLMDKTAELEMARPVAD